jgi:hypothetical protein
MTKNLILCMYCCRNLLYPINGKFLYKFTLENFYVENFYVHTILNVDQFSMTNLRKFSRHFFEKQISAKGLRKDPAAGGSYLGVVRPGDYFNLATIVIAKDEQHFYSGRNPDTQFDEQVRRPLLILPRTKSTFIVGETRNRRSSMSRY